MIAFDGAAVRRLREAKGLSLEQLTRRMTKRLGRGITKAAISSWERGLCCPGQAHLCAMSEALGVDDMNVFFSRRQNHGA